MAKTRDVLLIFAFPFYGANYTRPQDVTPSDIALQVYEHPMPKCCIDGFHSIFSLGHLRALHHHAPC